MISLSDEDKNAIYEAITAGLLEFSEEDERLIAEAVAAGLLTERDE